MLCLRLEKFSAPKPGSSGLLVEFTLSNPVPRSVSILSYDFELWLLADMGRSRAMFLSKLSPDFLTEFSDCSKVDPMGEKPLALIWHYLPRQLQEIEDWRKGLNPIFEIRAHACAMSIWSSSEKAAFGWEKVYGSTGQTRGFPFRFAYPVSEWARLLDEIGFRHIILYEFPIPAFPPTFSRAGRFLQEAWDHHRAGRSDESLLSCRKAFECLGYDVYGASDLSRQDILERMMSKAPVQQKIVIEKHWEALQNVLNEGIHEYREPVHFSHADTEMVLVGVSAFLGYLAKSSQAVIDRR